MPVNVYETDEALVVVAPLPGVMGDDVTVTVERGLVTIEAAMRTAAPKRYLAHEVYYLLNPGQPKAATSSTDL